MLDTGDGLANLYGFDLHLASDSWSYPGHLTTTVTESLYLYWCATVCGRYRFRRGEAFSGSMSMER